MGFAACVLGIVTALSPILPNALDKEGLGLRIYNFSVRGPYLVGEAIDRVRFQVTLLNYSKDPLEHDPLVVAVDVGDLTVFITGPDGKRIPRLGGRPSLRNPLTQPIKLRPGEFEWHALPFVYLGYGVVFAPGQYRVDGSLRIDKRTITSPPAQFEVVEVPASAVLLSHAVPLEGREAQRPVEKQRRPFVQQVHVGKKTLLIYRIYHGPNYDGEIEWTFRLAELPGKVEMTVEGAVGARNPLIITYKTSLTAKPTTLVINSVNGLPWTEEEERLRLERLRKVPPVKK